MYRRCGYVEARMALTNAEKQKQWRERWNERAGAFEGNVHTGFAARET
jgi:hypothetical protein